MLVYAVATSPRPQNILSKDANFSTAPFARFIRANLTPSHLKANLTPSQQKANLTPSQQKANLTPSQQKANLTPSQQKAHCTLFHHNP
ncbi:unnamed protein product [Merluccius merluccius]